jgi:hypothetical protein
MGVIARVVCYGCRRLLALLSVCLVDIFVLWLFSDMLKFAGFEFWACLQCIDGAAEYLYQYSGLISDYLWYPRHRSLWRWIVLLERVFDACCVFSHGIVGTWINSCWWSVHSLLEMWRFLLFGLFIILFVGCANAYLKMSFCLWTKCSNMNVLMMKVNLSDLYLVVNGMIFKYQWEKKNCNNL